MGDYNRVFFVCPALDSINVDGLNEYLPFSFDKYIPFIELAKTRESVCSDLFRCIPCYFDPEVVTQLVTRRDRKNGDNQWYKVKPGFATRFLHSPYFTSIFQKSTPAKYNPSRR